MLNSTTQNTSHKYTTDYVSPYMTYYPTFDIPQEVITRKEAFDRAINVYNTLKHNATFANSYETLFSIAEDIYFYCNNIKQTKMEQRQRITWDPEATFEFTGQEFEIIFNNMSTFLNGFLTPKSYLRLADIMTILEGRLEKSIQEGVVRVEVDEPKPNVEKSTETAEKPKAKSKAKSKAK